MGYGFPAWKESTQIIPSLDHALGMLNLYRQLRVEN